jgi:hypothetical protein
MVTPTCSPALNCDRVVIPFTNNARGKDVRTDCRCRVKSARHDVKRGLLVDVQTFEQKPIHARQQPEANTMHRLGGGCPEYAAALEQDVETHKRIVHRFHRQ